MKSRTLFFNGTVLRKDITRFAPVWGLYTVYLIFCIYNIFAFREYGEMRNYVTYLLTRGNNSVVLVYAFLCALLLFGDLFQSRLCNALHAMPLQRETWFCTHVLSGILFFVVPTTLAAIIRIPLMKEYAFLACLWWLAEVGSFLLLFSLAVLCVMCAGNRLGHATAFGIIGFLPMLVYGIFSNVYEPILHGISTDGSFAAEYSPATVLRSEYFHWEQPAGTYEYMGIYPKDWIILAVCIVVSVFLYWSALQLYKHRKLEWAGDFLNYKILHWTLLVLGSFYAAIIIPVVGFIIGFFVLCMLLERTVKVFHKRNWLRFALLTVVIIMTLGLTVLDPIGVTRYIPKPQQVESIGIGHEEYYSDYTLLQDSESIQAAMDMHEYAMEHTGLFKDFAGEDYYDLRLSYHLDNGRTVVRSYSVPMNSAPIDTLQKRLSSFEVLFGTKDVDAFVSSVYSVQLNLDNDKEIYTPLYQWNQIPPEQFEKLFDSIMQDCETGKMIQHNAFHTDPSYNHDTLRIWYHGAEGDADITLKVFPDSQTYVLLTQ